MRLTHRNRRSRGHRSAPRISISQAEITADLLYPAGRRPGPVERAAAARSDIQR
jgi:hypothetical protein